MELDIVNTLIIMSVIINVATIAARLTKTKKDDGWVQTARKILEVIGNLGLPDRVEFKRRKK